jgi:hypothetical protein
VDFLIHPSDIRLDLASGGNRTGKLQVELLAYDRQGHAVNWVGGTEIIDLTPGLYEKTRESGIRAHFDLDVPANSEVLLDTGVYDWGTGKVGTLEVPLQAATSTMAATPRTN